MAKRIAAILLLLVVALPLAGFGVAAGMGLKRAVVLTGSMEPTYPVGSMTFVQPLDPVQVQLLQPDEPIMFWSPDDFSQSVTHRLVEVRPEGLVTRGDANNVEDDWIVPREAVLGRVVWHVPAIGFATSRLQDGNAAMVVIGALAALFILNELVRIGRTIAAGRREEQVAGATRAPSLRPPDLDESAFRPA
jgi:signal peptidase